MTRTPNPYIDELISELLTRIQCVLGNELVGLYLFGSLVEGDFDKDASDIDLLAAVAHDIDDPQLEALLKMHERFVADHLRWADRVEVAYVSVAALRTFKERSSRIAIISPGESLHFKEAGIEWLMNWYLVLKGNTVLFGPPPEESIPPISKKEFVEAVRINALGWERWVDQLHERKARSYAILTMSRALYAHRLCEHTSKERAARWVQHQFPNWADLIQDAVLWRRGASAPGVTESATVVATYEFLQSVSKELSTSQ